MRSALDAPALFIASKAMPPLIAPSPITAMARRFSPSWAEAMAMPSAALIEVLRQEYVLVAQDEPLVERFRQ